MTLHTDQIPKRPKRKKESRIMTHTHTHPLRLMKSVQSKVTADRIERDLSPVPLTALAAFNVSNYQYLYIRTVCA